jgi:hypothetical protein
VDLLAVAVQRRQWVEVQRVDGVEMGVTVVVLENAVREGCVGTQMLGDVEMEGIAVVRRWCRDGAGQGDAEVAEPRFRTVSDAHDLRR